MSRVPIHDHTNIHQGGKIRGAAITGVGIITDLGEGATGGTGADGAPGSDAAMPWYNVQTDGACIGDGVTDDTVALQAAITAATASGTQSATLYFPPGVYLIGGALQDTGAFNAQILLPTVATSSKQVVITFIGAASAPLEWIGPSAPGVGSGYSVIKSTLTGASGTAACISGGNNGSGLANINNIRPVFERLLFIGPDNPTFTMLNLEQCQGADLRFCQISPTGGYAGSPVQPTHSNAYGVKMPGREMSDYSSTDGLSSAGWYTCVKLGELDVHRGLVTGNCIVSLEAPVSYYPTVIESMTATVFQYGIKATGYHPITIENYLAEHLTGSPSWGVTVYDVDDASNYLVGRIQWYGGATGGAPDHLFTKNGGTGLVTYELGTSPALGSSNFATPAVVLGTAAAAGAATTTIRSDSTIVAFDATVPTTIAYGDAAATGSAAKAARRDHAHGMAAASGGIGEILIVDTGASTPLIFADLLQNEAQDDLVYADP